MANKPASSNDVSLVVSLGKALNGMPLPSSRLVVESSRYRAWLPILTMGLADGARVHS